MRHGYRGPVRFTVPFFARPCPFRIAPGDRPCSYETNRVIRYVMAFASFAFATMPSLSMAQGDPSAVTAANPCRAISKAEQVAASIPQNVAAQEQVGFLKLACGIAKTDANVGPSKTVCRLELEAGDTFSVAASVAVSAPAVANQSDADRELAILRAREDAIVDWGMAYRAYETGAAMACNPEGSESNANQTEASDKAYQAKRHIADIVQHLQGLQR